MASCKETYNTGEKKKNVSTDYQGMENKLN